MIPGEMEQPDSKGGGGAAAALTLLALCAFAANSLLGRLALGSGAIDAASYATVRLLAGAVVLVPLAYLRAGRPSGSWGSAAMLCAYAVPFAFAYRTLSAGTGALILFAAVQITMISAGLRSGERPGAVEWLGLALAFSGLAYLVFPGLAAPSPAGAGLMAVAGVAWGAYSLRGRRAGRPLAETAGNFARALLLAAIVSGASIASAHATLRGIVLATLSGAVASGVGYAIWYAALPRLTATVAATVQLAVPVLAAAGGVALLGERVTARLVLASVAILGGVGLALAFRGKKSSPAAFPGDAAGGPGKR
jgi:drug/metabolite transporter (DMT)-like permease